MTVIAISGDDMIVITEQGNGSDGNGFLSYVKVKEAAYRSGVVVLQLGLLEAAYTDHLAKQFDLIICG